MYSKHFEEVKRYFDTGVWNEEKVRAAVDKNWINASEFQEITGHGILGN